MSWSWGQEEGIFTANPCYCGLRRQFGSRIFCRLTKLMLYKTLIRPVLFYDSETWPTSKASKQEILVFERSVLLQIFEDILTGGPRVVFLVQGALCSPCNEDRETYQVPDISQGWGMTKFRNQSWRNHFMEQRWVRNWMASAQNHNDWQKLLEEAKTRRRVALNENKKMMPLQLVWIFIFIFIIIKNFCMTSRGPFAAQCLQMSVYISTNNT